MYEQSPYPKFSWSHSRDRLLGECERRYFWHYYGSHNGWMEESSGLARVAYRLKQLTDLPLVLGQAVHAEAKKILRTVRARRRRPSLEEVRQGIRNELNHVWRSSVQNREGFLKRPNRTPMLLPIYYKRRITPQAIERVKEKANACANHLTESAVWSEVERCGPADLLVADSITSFIHNGVETYAVPDLLYRMDGTWIILDWKTGKPGPVEQQLAVYGLYLRDRIGPPDGTAPWAGRVIRLDSGEEIVYPIAARHLDQADSLIASSIMRMRRFVVDGDLERNQPRAREEFGLVQDQRRCPWCPFYELCRPELDERARQGPS